MYIYVIHFDVRLAHAGHYIGSTTNLRARMQAHARGHGARLTEVLFDQNRDWQLCRILKCDGLSARAIERLIKHQNNGPRYCPICTATPTTPHGTCPIDISLLTMPTRSEKIRKEPK